MGLIGRIAEMEVVQTLLDDVRARSSEVLVVPGPAGIGKIALLRETAERAASAAMRLAQAAGIQPEKGFDFAGLHQMLDQAGLPAVRRRLPPGSMLDWPVMTAALAAQEP